MCNRLFTTNNCRWNNSISISPVYKQSSEAHLVPPMRIKNNTEAKQSLSNLVYKARSARSADWPVLFMVWIYNWPMGHQGPEIPLQQAHKFGEVTTSCWTLVRPISHPLLRTKTSEWPVQCSRRGVRGVTYKGQQLKGSRTVSKRTEDLVIPLLQSFLDRYHILENIHILLLQPQSYNAADCVPSCTGPPPLMLWRVSSSFRTDKVR